MNIPGQSGGPWSRLSPKFLVSRAVHDRDDCQLNATTFRTSRAVYGGTFQEVPVQSGGPRSRSPLSSPTVGVVGQAHSAASCFGPRSPSFVVYDQAGTT
jgi:hypothetical protein